MRSLPNCSARISATLATKARLSPVKEKAIRKRFSPMPGMTRSSELLLSVQLIDAFLDDRPIARLGRGLEVELEVFDGLGGFSRLGVGEPESAMTGRIFGVQLERLVELGDGVRGFALEELGVSALVGLVGSRVVFLARFATSGFGLGGGGLGLRLLRGGGLFGVDRFLSVRRLLRGFGFFSVSRLFFLGVLAVGWFLRGRGFLGWSRLGRRGLLRQGGRLFAGRGLGLGGCGFGGLDLILGGWLPLDRALAVQEVDARTDQRNQCDGPDYNDGCLARRCLRLVGVFFLAGRPLGRLASLPLVALLRRGLGLEPRLGRGRPGTWFRRRLWLVHLRGCIGAAVLRFGREPLYLGQRRVGRRGRRFEHDRGRGLVRLRWRLEHGASRNRIGRLIHVDVDVRAPGNGLRRLRLGRRCPKRRGGNSRAVLRGRGGKCLPCGGGRGGGALGDDFRNRFRGNTRDRRAYSPQHGPCRRFGRRGGRRRWHRGWRSRRGWLAGEDFAAIGTLGIGIVHPRPVLRKRQPTIGALHRSHCHLAGAGPGAAGGA